MALGWAARLAIVWCLLALLGDVLSQAQAQESTTSGDKSGVIQEIRVEGNQRIEAATIRSYMTVAPGEPFDPAKLDQSLKNLFATGLFDDVSIRREGDDARGHPGREPDHQPHRLRGQPAARRRRADHGGAVAAARRLHPLAGAERGQPHPRAVSPQRPLRRHGRAQGDPAAAEPRRPGVRDQRGPAHRDRAHRLHRQPGVRRRRPARRDPDQGIGLVPLPDAATTPTIRTGWPSTRSCCAGSTWRAAMPTSTCARRSPS